jgi:hypothetical protein
MNTAFDIDGVKLYKEDRDSKMYTQFTKKKMTIYEIAMRWGVPWYIVKSALEREAKKQEIILNFKENMLARRKRV